MPYVVTTPPTAEPIDVEDAKVHASILHDDDNVLIGRYITAARELVEHETDRQLMPATLRLSLDRFPTLERGVIRLERPPVRAIEEITYTDPLGNEMELGESAYQVDLDSMPPRLWTGYDLYWPATRDIFGSVRITFTAGYADADAVPEAAKQAIRLLVAHWYENREAVGNVGKDVERSYQSLIYSLRWR